MEYKPNPELEKLRAEKEKNEKEIEQLDHKITRLENRQKYYEDGERKRRTHRLCTIAGTLESIAPEIKELDITEVMELYYGATNNGKREGAFFDCSLHWKHKDKCGTHFIRESVLERMVLKHIQLVMGYILRYRQHFIFVMEQQLQLESAEKLQTSRKQLERNERRIAELKRLFIKIYEDNAKGNLSDERFDMMSQNYEAEQKQLEAEVVALRHEIEVQERQSENIEQFIRTADKYVDIEEIDPCMLRELIKAIYVEAPDKSSGKRSQKIHIEYDGIGFIPLEELAKKETA